MRFFWYCFLLITIFYGVCIAGTTPVKSWEKVLSSDCYFIACAGDSIICVGKTISVLSRNGVLVAESPPLDDTKSISNGSPPVFYLTKDHSLLMVKDRCMVKKISLGGEITWSSSLCDSITDAVFNGFTEDAEGNGYLCGSAGNQSGVIVKIGNGGMSIYRADTSLPIFSSMVWLKDTLFVVVRRIGGSTGGGSLVAFDDKGVFAERIIDTGCGSLMMIDEDDIFSIGTQDGAQWLFKKKLSITSDLSLKKYSIKGAADTTVIFDFGKFEYPYSIQKYHEGILMITVSDESVNMGSNCLNYFITRLDASFGKQWQLHFGTDSSDYTVDEYDFRYFSADDRGMILATHNDTLFNFTDESVNIQNRLFHTGTNSSAFSGGIVTAFDCRGRLLFVGPARNGLNETVLKRIEGGASGVLLLRMGNNSEGATRVFHLKR